MRFLLLLMLMLMLWGVVFTQQVRAAPDEARLYTDLRTSYDALNPDRAVIPVGNVSETRLVDFRLTLMSFLSIDADTGIASFSTWEEFTWHDAFLKWNPDEYGGVDMIRMPIERIWQPDIVLYNGFDPSDVRQVLAMVSYDGEVMYAPPVYRQVACNINATDVLCTMKFGSWTYNGFRLDLALTLGSDTMDLSSYDPNRHYRLVTTSAVKNVKYYPCCVEPYPDLTFSMHFKKNDGVDMFVCLYAIAACLIAQHELRGQ